MYKQFFTLFTLLLPAFAVPSPLLTVSKVANATPDRYIITLKDGVSRPAHLSSIQRKMTSTSSKVTHEFDIINGYAGEFSSDDLNELRADPDIVSVEEDGTSHTFVTKTRYVHPHLRDLVKLQCPFFRNDAPWGLARISSQNKLSGSSDTALDFEYKYDSTAGSGATIYVIGASLTFAIWHASAYRGRQTLASSSTTPRLADGLHGGRPLVDTPTKMATAMALTVLEPLFLNHSVLQSRPTSLLSRS